MDENIAEEKALLFLLLRRHCRVHKKKVKKPTFWVRDIFRQRENILEIGSQGEYSFQKMTHASESVFLQQKDFP